MREAAVAEGRRLFVGGLPFRTTAEELAAYLRERDFDPVEVVIGTEPDGRSRGYAFVELPTASDAERVRRLLDGVPFQTRTLRCERARARVVV